MSKQQQILVGREMGNLEWQARFVVGIIKGVSSLTRIDLLNCLGRIGRSMELYGLKNIKEIDSGCVERYFAELRDKGLSSRRIAIHATAMRRLCRMMCIDDIVPSNRKLGCLRVRGEGPEVYDEQK